MIAEVILTFLRVGAVAFGGGIAALTMVIHEVVRQHAWLSMAEMNTIIAVAQMTPGPIMVNAATFVGYRIGGLFGAAAATAAALIPGLIMLLLFLQAVKLHARVADGKKGRMHAFGRRLVKALRPGVFALIVAAVWSVGSSAVYNPITAMIAVGGFIILVAFPRVHPILLIVAGGLLGLFVL
ncbi:MAG: chromate transporter [Spirochaetaceae bacterium]|nr:MAG: chromate transporter [Spirochaetaceae bacterium]